MRNDRIIARLLTGGLLLLAACNHPTDDAKREATAAAPASTSQPKRTNGPSDYVNRAPKPAKVGPHSLLALRSIEGRCEWSVLEPPEFTARQVMVSYACPPMPWSMAWSESTARSVFVLEGQLYVHDWRARRVAAFGSLPEREVAPLVGLSASGKPQLCSAVARPKPGADGPDENYFVRYEPDAPSGSWKEAAADAFDYAAGRPLCSGGDYLWEAGSVWYEPQTQLANNCVRDIAQRASNELCPSDVVIEELFRKHLHDGAEYIEYLLLGPERFLAYPTSQGDPGVAKFLPLIYIDRDRATVIYDRDRRTTMHIALAGDYLLARADGALNHATLFKQTTGQPQLLLEFPGETVVLWVPGTIPAGDLIRIERPSGTSPPEIETAQDGNEAGDG
jgi:hypothetical protein